MTAGGDPAVPAGAALVLDELRALGRGGGIAAISRLSGGSIADAWLVTYADGTEVVGKTVTADLPGVFAVEAAGLAALRDTGHLVTPRVLAVTSRLLLLEALAPVASRERSWERFARDLAAVHSGPAGNRFGWHHDGYLGRIRQVNTWTGDGHEFFAEHRLLRYLNEPPAEQALNGADRRAVERLCARLPEVIPAMPAVLTHGDLWSGNLVSRPGGRIAVIDPAVSYTWAEVDLSMLWCSPRPPAAGRFFEVYAELSSSPPGWADRMPVLHLRELFSMIATFGPAAVASIAQAREILAPFYPRRQPGPAR
jgi:fructosamine-3-kinase